MKLKEWIIGGVAVVALVLSVVGGGSTTTIVEKVVGDDSLGSSGSEFFSKIAFRDDVVIGGKVFSTSSIGSVTYTAASIINSKVIEHQAASAVTASLPTEASLSSAGFLPNVGDTEVLFITASTTAITLAGNTNLTLTSASSTLVIGKGRTGRIEFVRTGATEGRKIQAVLTVGGL